MLQLCVTAFLLAAPEIDRMTEPRRDAALALLGDGRVLATGGAGSSDGALATAEVFDPVSGKWTAVAPMAFARVGHGALSLKDGRVLVFGGEPMTGPAPEAPLEIFDPKTGKWTSVPLPVPRRWVAAALAGNRLIVAGGQAATEAVDTVDELDLSTGVWSRAAPLTKPRFLHAVTALPGGQLIASGGHTQSKRSLGVRVSPGLPIPLPAVLSGSTELDTFELYDPKSRAWKSFGCPGKGHCRAVGSLGSSSAVLTGAFNELWFFNAADGTLRKAPPAPPKTVLSGWYLTRRDGSLICVGSWKTAGSKSVWLLEATQWKPLAPLTEGRARLSMVELADGAILVAGGEATDASGNRKALSSCERIARF